MAASRSVYTYLSKLFWGSSCDNDAAEDAVGVFPPRGAIVAINSCSRAATLSLNNLGVSDNALYGTKFVRGASVALGIVAGAGCPLAASSASRTMMEDARDIVSSCDALRLPDSFMDDLAGKVATVGGNGAAAASLVVVNQQELHIASTKGCSKTIVVRRGKNSDEVVLVGEEAEVATSADVQEFPLGGDTAVKTFHEWRRLKQDWEWVLMGSRAFWSLITPAEAAKMISAQASRGVEPAGIVRALAQAAAECDAAGSTAAHIALSLARLDPLPGPSFATSPRIGASRRISEPCSDAAGIWQMAPTSASAAAAVHASPTVPNAPYPLAAAIDERTGEHTSDPLMNIDAEHVTNAEGGHTAGASSVSGELTAEPVRMHATPAATPSSREFSRAGLGAAAGPSVAAREEEACEEREQSLEELLRAVRLRSDKGDQGEVGRCALPDARDPWGPAQSVAEAPHKLGQLRPRRPSWGPSRRPSQGPSGAGSSWAGSACSRDFGAGRWWRVSMHAEVEVPEDDSPHEWRAAAAARAAVPGGADGGRTRRRGVRRVLRAAAAGAAVVAARLLLCKRAGCRSAEAPQ
eukprot:jgi/Ulvmu1/2820/UM142_0018.1